MDVVTWDPKNRPLLNKRHPLNELAAVIKRARKDAKSKDQTVAQLGAATLVNALAAMHTLTNASLYETAEQEAEAAEDPQLPESVDDDGSIAV